MNSFQNDIFCLTFSHIYLTHIQSVARGKMSVPCWRDEIHTICGGKQHTLTLLRENVERRKKVNDKRQKYSNLLLTWHSGYGPYAFGVWIWTIIFHTFQHFSPTSSLSFATSLEDDLPKKIREKILHSTTKTFLTKFIHDFNEQSLFGLVLCSPAFCRSPTFE